ncbi:MAG: CDGSH iron-sulfur domain-containing protein [Actinomycetota bacterium]
MPDHGYRVRITEDGPYEVTGSPPLVRTAQVETEFGEPIGWEEPTPIDAPDEFDLCRCGASSRKPFCDASHETAPFDGTEVADRRLRAERARVLEGDGVVMTDDRSLCAHAGHCADRFTDVWEMIRGTSDPAIRARLRRMVELCPSGRLAHAPPGDAELVEPEFDPAIAVIEDGPLWVRGGIPVESSDGTTYEVRDRVTLCRCGHSNNKPFCDGTHKVVGFRDP